MNGNGEPSILEKLDGIGEPLKAFDAFPKVQATYKTRRGGGGFLTILACALSVVLILNDLAEFMWGWSDHEFSVDKSRQSYIPINFDMVIAMPCTCEYPAAISTTHIANYLQTCLWTCAMRWVTAYI